MEELSARTDLGIYYIYTMFFFPNRFAILEPDSFGSYLTLNWCQKICFDPISLVFQRGKHGKYVHLFYCPTCFPDGFSFTMTNNSVPF